MLAMVGLATLATVIASQALISGAYSVTKQVMQLGYLPRLRVQHTSAEESGQIYLPFVNWGLFVCIVLAVGMFKTSSNLAAAYGIAVTLVMLITTVMTFFVIRYHWGYPLWLCVGATSLFFLIDLAFFSSNLLKLTEGGWFPLVIGGLVFLLMSTWHEGRRLLNQSIRNHWTCATSSTRSSAARRCARRGRRSSCPPSRARCPTHCCTTSSTTRCCTSATCS